MDDYNRELSSLDKQKCAQKDNSMAIRVKSSARFRVLFRVCDDHMVYDLIHKIRITQYKSCANNCL